MCYVVLFFFFIQVSANLIDQGQSAVRPRGPRGTADQPEIRDSFLEAATLRAGPGEVNRMLGGKGALRMPGSYPPWSLRAERPAGPGTCVHLGGSSRWPCTGPRGPVTRQGERWCPRDRGPSTADPGPIEAYSPLIQ